MQRESREQKRLVADPDLFSKKQLLPPRVLVSPYLVASLHNFVEASTVVTKHQQNASGSKDIPHRIPYADGCGRVMIALNANGAR